ncbi:hypothetical protein [Nocardioides coralli]|uniref:hypothetical protein n=1 Tax=Nocardioides coralli TaxID=2872154 RepID=UPI001CA46951|nr:hypothetical protein [Nocardioides coralli]QZY29950.1 hypothetical protein K6T13_04485 [Nocardioides coralli]
MNAAPRATLVAAPPAPPITTRHLRAALLALLLSVAVVAVALAQTSGSAAWTLGAAVLVCYAGLGALPLWLAGSTLAAAVREDPVQNLRGRWTAGS